MKKIDRLVLTIQEKYQFSGDIVDDITYEELMTMKKEYPDGVDMNSSDMLDKYNHVFNWLAENAYNHLKKNCTIDILKENTCINEDEEEEYKRKEMMNDDFALRMKEYLDKIKAAKNVVNE